MAKKVKVNQLPKCDFCGDPARYDGKTVMGPWADMCAKHWKLYGIGLGTGRGQELVLDDVPSILDVHDVNRESDQ